MPDNRKRENLFKKGKKKIYNWIDFQILTFAADNKKIQVAAFAPDIH